MEIAAPTALTPAVSADRWCVVWSCTRRILKARHQSC